MRIQEIIIVLLFLFVSFTSVSAQTTVFTYQGKLTDTGTPQSVYEMQFSLYGSAGGSDQIGATITNPNISVNQGVFIVQFDFGEAAFPGADRFLLISVRRSSTESFVTLNPRQQITSSPYSIRTLSAAQADVALDSNKLGGVDASEYVTTSSVGNSFITNSTTQQTADFNISGNGIVGGNLGVGTTAPTTKLQIKTVSGDYGFTQTDGAITVGSYVGGSSSGATGGWLGTLSNNKLLFFTNNGQPSMTVDTTGNVGIGTTAPQAALHVVGNTVQDRNKGGMVKALLYVAGDGTIQRCYNGVSGASTGNCGFSVSGGSSGNYSINLGFQVTDRFLSATARGVFVGIGVPITTMGADFRFSSLPNANPNEVTIDTFRTDTGETVSSPFMLIVY